MRDAKYGLDGSHIDGWVENMRSYAAGVAERHSYVQVSRSTPLAGSRGYSLTTAMSRSRGMPSGTAMSRSTGPKQDRMLYLDQGDCHLVPLCLDRWTETRQNATPRSR